MLLNKRVAEQEVQQWSVT